MRAVLLALALMAGAPHASALDACFADSVGGWRGRVFSDGELEGLDTEFRLGPDGGLTGTYHVEAEEPYDGTLTGFRQTGACEAAFAWTDRYGAGVVRVRFAPAEGRFAGEWGSIVPIPGYVFNGFRVRPAPVS